MTGDGPATEQLDAIPSPGISRRTHQAADAKLGCSLSDLDRLIRA